MMSDRWYYKSRRAIRGPVTADELVALLKDRQLASETPVRHGTGGRWLPAADALSEASRDEGTDKVAARLLAGAGPARFSGLGGRGASRWPASGLLGGIGYLLASLVEGIVSVAQPAVSWTARVFGRKAILAVAFAVLAVLVLRSTPLLDSPLSDVHGRLEVIWEEARALRDGADSSQEREQLVSQSIAELKPMVEELEETHRRREKGLWAVFFGPGKSAWARRELIQVTKYDLPAALRAGPDEAPRYDALVDGRLAKADEYAAMAALYAAHSPGLTETGRQSGRIAESDESGLLVGAIIAVDIAFFGGLAFFWWRKRRSNA